MLGRAVLALCLLVGVAHACPIRFKNAEEKAHFNAMVAKQLQKIEADQRRLDAPMSGDASRGAAIVFAVIGLLGLAVYPSRLA
jgi:hypothetical protein